MVIGDDSHYLKKEDRYIHKAYLNSKGGERETDLFYEYSYLQDENDIRKNLEPSEIDVDDCCNNSIDLMMKIETYDLLHSQTIPSVPIQTYVPCVDPSIEKYKNLYKMKNSDNDYDRYWVNQCIIKMKEILKVIDTIGGIKKIIHTFYVRITLFQHFKKDGMQPLPINDKKDIIFLVIGWRIQDVFPVLGFFPLYANMQSVEFISGTLRVVVALPLLDKVHITVQHLKPVYDIFIYIHIDRTYE